MLPRQHRNSRERAEVDTRSSKLPWDGDDRRLKLSMALKVGTMMARFERRGLVEKVGTRDGATLWRLAAGR